MSAKQDHDLSPKPGSLFRWICLCTAILFGLLMVWMIYDLKQQVRHSLETAQQTLEKSNNAVSTVNEELPAILAEVKKGTETLADLSEDVKLIKSIAGIRNDESDRGLLGLANYANEIEQVLADAADEHPDAKVLMKELIGSDLKEKSSLPEFIVGLNKEMVTLILPFSKSREEILYRTCTSSPPRRVPFYIQIPGQDPVDMREFIIARHKPSAELPAYPPKDPE